MPNPLSTLGIAHTLLSLIPIVAGLYGFARRKRIDPSTTAGRVYLAGLSVSVLTSFGLSSSGHVNAGHVLGVLALLAAFGGAWVAPRLTVLGRLRVPAQTFGLSFSYFLLMVPGINETLSRLPVGHALATGPEDPLVKTVLLVWLVIFVVGFTAQCLALRDRARR